MGVSADGSWGGRGDVGEEMVLLMCDGEAGFLCAPKSLRETSHLVNRKVKDDPKRIEYQEPHTRLLFGSHKTSPII